MFLSLFRALKISELSPKKFSFLQFPNNCWQSLKLKDCGPERGAVYATLRRMTDELSQPPPMPPLAGQGPVGTDRTGCQVPWAEQRAEGEPPRNLEDRMGEFHQNTHCFLDFSKYFFERIYIGRCKRK